MNEQTQTSRAAKTRPWLVFAGCCLLMLSVFTIHGTCATLLVAPVTGEMGYTRAEFTLGISIGSILQIFSAPLVAKALGNKKIGSRGVISIALVLFALVYTWLSRATHVWEWQVGFTLTGVIQTFCASIVVQNLLNNWFKDKLGFVIGASAAMSGLGGAVFSPIVSNVIANYGWRTACIVMAVIVVVIGLPLAATVLRFTPQECGCQPYVSAKKKETEAQSYSETLTGMTRKEALRSPVFYFAFFASVMFGFSAAINTHAPSIAAKTFDVVTMGTMVSVFSVCSALGKIILGMINDKFGINGSTLFGAVGMVAGTLLMIISSTNAMRGLMYVSFALIGLGASTNTLTPPLIVTASMGRKCFGDIYGLIVPAFVIGVAVGIPMSGMIYDKSGSYNVALASIIAFSILACVCTMIAAHLGKKKLREMSE